MNVDLVLADNDVALIENPENEDQAYLIEQLAGNRFNVWNVDTAGDTIGDASPFESLSDALQHVSELVE